MVTEAGKELLRNTINTAKFHNRILEENEMWKQWELERGLTMMVSDDVILSKSKKHHHHHQCSKHRRRNKSSSTERVKLNREPDEACSSRDTVDRWDHSGFRELYPDEVDSGIYNSPSTRDNGKKWDHSGFLELYPEEAHRESQSTSRSKEHPKQKKKKRKHHSEVSTSDNEIWEDFKTYKRSKAAKKSKSSYDGHVKEWKKQFEKSPNM